MQFFRKIANVFLALLLMVSTMGVTLHKHYCMGQLKDVAIFHEADSCMSSMGMDSKKGCPLDCCDDTTEELRVDDLQKVTFEHKLTPDYNVLAVITYALIDAELLSLSSNQTAYLNYKPPLIEQDIPVFVQSFLL